MFNKLVIIFLSCFLCLKTAHAYEFKKISNLFTMLEQDYPKQVDYKYLFDLSRTTLLTYDSDIHIYSSGTKAFLYKQNNLIKTFLLPNNNKSDAWQKFFALVLKTSAQHSKKISAHMPDLEHKIFLNIMQTLDGYTRVEPKRPEIKNMNHTIIDDILYVKSTLFYKGFTNDLKDLIKNTAKAKGIILDLRGNSGGKLDEAIRTSDLFLDNGLITYCKEKNRPIRYYTATQGDIFPNRKIIILTNEYTASAAEIVVAALSEQNRAIIIGSKTYGKGSLQRLGTLDNDTLFVTSGYFFSPSGQHINNFGIMPTICTGQNGSCDISDKTSANTDILLAINIIKNNLS